MKTEQRPKLLRDWPHPERETIPAGTIGRVDGECYVFDVPGADEWGFVGVMPMRLQAEWFDLVTVCLTCQREVCPAPNCDTPPYLRDTPSYRRYCHGHDEPKRNRIKSYESHGDGTATLTMHLTLEQRDAVYDALGIEDWDGSAERWEPDLDETKPEPLKYIPCNHCGQPTDIIDVPTNRAFRVSHNVCPPKPEPPYPIPDDEGCYFVALGNDTRWRTREHAEQAAKAHAKLDEVLQAAFNVAAGAVGRTGMWLMDEDCCVQESKRGGEE